MRTSTSERANARLIGRLRARAVQEGFDVCRIVQPNSIEAAGERLREWLAEGRHGDMDWMKETEERRADPRTLWPNVRSIVILAINYGPKDDPRAEPSWPSSGRISVYARGRDYHDVIKGKLKTLASWIHRETMADVKVFVDTAPVMEKPLAHAAGIGWQGKHTNLVSPAFGSWLFLGSIFTTLELEPDPPSEDHCGICRACLDACPTGALPAPYQIDARRCVSYLTIEHKGHVDRDLRVGIGNRIYGCDDCLAVCPWNKFAELGREAKLQARDDLGSPPLSALARLNDADFRRLFAAGPIKRVGHVRFLRNVLIAIGNSGNPDLAGAAKERLGHPSPLVRAMAVWALSRLLPTHEALTEAARFADQECDVDVRAEWDELRKQAEKASP